MIRGTGLPFDHMAAMLNHNKRKLLFSPLLNPPTIRESTFNKHSCTKPFGHPLGMIHKLQAMPNPTERQHPARCAKRRWMSDQSNTAQVPVLHSKTFWFRDGTIILQAQNTQFRVHLSFLGANSEVFNEKSLMSQIGVDDDSDSVEGCSIFSVNDLKEDRENFLHMMYYPGK
jgi:hypothetical protein